MPNQIPEPARDHPETGPQARLRADLEGWDAIADHRTGTAGDEATAHWLARCVRQAGPVVTPPGQRPLGEASNLFDGGGRFISLLGSNRLLHHPNDRWPHAVAAPRTVRLTQAPLNVVQQLVSA